MENEEVQGALEIVGPTEESVPVVMEWSEPQLKAIVEAVVYVTDEPLSADQIAAALQQPAATVARILEELAAEYNKPEHGLTLREVAGGYKLSTKPEHHEAIRAFVKNLKPPMKLSLPALETLALIAYKQPVTVPEIAEIRNVQGAGVVKTLLDRKLIAVAGRKKVLGNPMLYKTTKEFLVQFGLKDLSELPTLKEFEELGRLSMGEASGEEGSGEAEPTPTSEQPPPAAPETAE
jgi:segregation and condensation protein B